MEAKKIGRLIAQIALLLDEANYGKVSAVIDDIAEEINKDNWTMCSDELPDKDDSYLVLWIDKRGLIPFYGVTEYYKEEESWGHIQQAVGYAKILAWQELPEIPEELK